MSFSLGNGLRITAVMLCFGFSGLSQAIVSMESVHLGKPPQGFEGNFDLKLNAEYGNTEKQSTSTGLKLQWTGTDKTDFVLASYDQGEVNGQTNKEKSFVHLRHIQTYSDQSDWEMFVQFSKNKFTRLTLRALLGGGMRFKLGQSGGSNDMYLGLGAFAEREDIDQGETNTAARGNFYFVAKHRFNEHVSLVSTSYYQPVLDDVDDFRAIENASLVSKLSESLSMRVLLDVQHNSRPPAGVEKTDTSVSLGFSLKF